MSCKTGKEIYILNVLEMITKKYDTSTLTFMIPHT